MYGLERQRRDVKLERGTGSSCAAPGRPRAHASKQPGSAKSRKRPRPAAGQFRIIPRRWRRTRHSRPLGMFFLDADGQSASSSAQIGMSPKRSRLRQRSAERAKDSRGSPQSANSKPPAESIEHQWRFTIISRNCPTAAISTEMLDRAFRRNARENGLTASRSCISTSIVSSRSTTRSATAPATPC